MEHPTEAQLRAMRTPELNKVCARYGITPYTRLRFEEKVVRILEEVRQELLSDEVA